MKNKLVKKLGILLLSVSLIGSLSGCGTESSAVSDNNVGNVVSNEAGNNYEVLVDHDESASTIIMKIDDYEVTREELYLFILQYLYNNNTLADSITDSEYANIVNMCIDEIKMETVEYKLAIVTDGVAVDDAALANASNTALSFWNYFGEEFLSKYGISREAVNTLFEHQVYIEALKNKAMQDLTNDYKQSYNDQYKDMKFFTIYYALFPNIKIENNEPVLDSEGKNVMLSDEEMEEQLRLANECRDRAVENVKNGEVDGNLEELVEEYGISRVSGTEHNYYGVYTDELNKLVESLTDGDISEVVKTETGYMIVRMDNSDDQEFKNFSIDYMASQSAQNLYPNMQDSWVKSSGVAELGVDPMLLQGLKIVDMCKDMNAAGYSISGSN